MKIHRKGGLQGQRGCLWICVFVMCLTTRFVYRSFATRTCLAANGTQQHPVSSASLDCRPSPASYGIEYWTVPEGEVGLVTSKDLVHSSWHATPHSEWLIKKVSHRHQQLVKLFSRHWNQLL